MSKSMTKTEETKKQGELTEAQLNDVSGGPIYMNPTNVTLVPAVQTNPTMPTNDIIAVLRH